MLLGDSSALLVAPEHSRQRRRRCSFFFSSPRTLRRAKMKRGKKAMSKSIGQGLGEVRRSFRFESAAAGDSVGAGGQPLLPLHKDNLEEAADHNVDVEENTSFVSLSCTLSNILKILEFVHRS